MADSKTGVKVIPDVKVKIKGTQIQGAPSKGVKIVDSKSLQRKHEFEEEHDESSS